MKINTYEDLLKLIKSLPDGEILNISLVKED